MKRLPKKSEVRESESPEDEQKAERPKPKARKKPVPRVSSSEDNSVLHTDEPKPEINKSETATALLSTAETKQQRKIKHPTSEISNMEVHHHPDLHHKEKPWKEYFLEFLMIFLAVMMGFFAETMRENIAENSKGRELAKSLYQEVYADSVTMHGKIEMRLKKEKQMEYFRKYISDSSLTHLSDKFYPAFVWSYVIITSNSFEPNDGILSQLRNSGSLRYFKNLNLQNSVSRINVIISKVRDRNSQELRFVEEYARPFMLKHYDFKWQDEYTQNGKLSITEALTQEHFHPSAEPFIKHLDELKRDDAEGLTAYYLLITRASRQIFYRPYIEANHQLLQALRNEYNFKDE
jgi:hypothetical protein